MNPRTSIDRLRECFNYDPETGVIRWNEGHGGRWGHLAGTQACHTLNSDGYLTGLVDGERLSTHRVAWALHTGAWPSDAVDHIDGDRKNNRFANLRAVDTGTNCKNRKLPSNNTSGVTGVSLEKNGKYRAKIKVNRRDINVGTFKTLEEATVAVRKAYADHGFHQNHGLSPDVVFPTRYRAPGSRKYASRASLVSQEAGE